MSTRRARKDEESTLTFCSDLQCNLGLTRGDPVEMLSWFLVAVVFARMCLALIAITIFFSSTVVCRRHRLIIIVSTVLFDC